MQGIIVSYRRSQRDITPNQAIIRIEGCKNRAEASKLVGKIVAWKGTKKTIAGKVHSAHGNSGCIRALFERGIPGQAITQPVEIQ
jgi:large subunit ribosomal protein L35Ae